MTGNEVLYDWFLKYFYDRYWAIMMVPNPVPNNLTGIEVLFSILTFSILNSMLQFSMSPFFYVLVYDIPVFSPGIDPGMALTLTISIYYIE